MIQFFSMPMLLVAGAFFLAGLFDSICGGGGLVTVPAMMAVGLPAHMVSGTNQGGAFIGALVSVAKFIRSGKVNYTIAAVSLPMSLLGGYAGSALNMAIPDRVLEIAMVGLVPVIAVVMLLKRNAGEEDHMNELSRTRQLLGGAAIGFFLGMYQGLYGPGSGMFCVLAFTLLLRMSLLHATANMRVIIGFAMFTATISYALNGMIDYRIALVGTVFNTVGNYVGAGLTLTKGAKIIRPMFFVVITLLFVKLVAGLFGI